MASTINPTLEGVLGGVPMQGIDFGYCGVSQETTRSFTLSNSSSAQVRFHISAEEKHFTVNCSQGKSLPYLKMEPE
jgi:hypothetical protein